MSHILLKLVQIQNIFELNLYLILLNSIKDYYVAMEHIENLYVCWNSCVYTIVHLVMLFCQAQPQSQLQLGCSWFYSQLLRSSGKPADPPE